MALSMRFCGRILALPSHFSRISTTLPLHRFSTATQKATDATPAPQSVTGLDAEQESSAPPTSEPAWSGEARRKLDEVGFDPANPPYSATLEQNDTSPIFRRTQTHQRGWGSEADEPVYQRTPVSSETSGTEAEVEHSVDVNMDFGTLLTMKYGIPSALISSTLSYLAIYTPLWELRTGFNPQLGIAELFDSWFRYFGLIDQHLNPVVGSLMVGIPLAYFPTSYILGRLAVAQHPHPPVAAKFADKQAAYEAARDKLHAELRALPPVEGYRDTKERFDYVFQEGAKLCAMDPRWLSMVDAELRTFPDGWKKKGKYTEAQLSFWMRYSSLETQFVQENDARLKLASIRSMFGIGLGKEATLRRLGKTPRRVY